MKRVMLLVSTVIMLLTLGNVAFGEALIEFQFGWDHPLTENCALGGQPVPDGRLVQIFWDENANGPDAADQPWPLNNCNFNADSLNGWDIGGQPGAYYSYWPYHIYTEAWRVWNVPSAPANRFFVKVYCANNTTPQYVSRAQTITSGSGQFYEFVWSDFTCVECGAFRVTAPNGGDVWRVGENGTVQWQASGYEGLLKIELNRNYPGGAWELLADNTANDGEEVITVTGPSSGTCRVRVSSIPDTLTDVSDADFRIECAPTALPFIDNFDGTMDSCWYWLDPQPQPENISFTNRPGWLGISTDMSISPYLCRLVPDTNCMIETRMCTATGAAIMHVTIAPQTTNLLVMQWFGQYHLFRSVMWTNGNPVYNDLTINADTICVRVVKIGTHYSAYARADGEDWQFVNAFDRQMATNGGLNVGLIADYALCEWDYFRVDSLPTVCGNVSGVWDAAHSPYYVTCDVTVPAGDTLRIEPGVRVEFLGPYSLTAYGTLLAEGTAPDSIVFTTNLASNPGRWRGIRLADTTSSGSRLSGCLIEHARNVDGDNTLGGGLRIINADPALVACTFRDNEASLGGALYTADGEVSVTACVFEDNRAQDGGAVYWTGGGGLLEQSRVMANRAEGYGGGVYLWNAAVGIARTEIRGNQAVVGHGGGVYSNGPNGSGITPGLWNCVIVGNSAGNCGGGVNAEWIPVIIAGCRIDSNQATAFGGGTSLFYTSAAVFSNVYTANSAAIYGGGGIYSVSATQTPRISYCTLNGNAAPLGGGLYLGGTSTLLSNSIIANSTQGQGVYFSDAPHTVRYCDVAANTGGAFGGFVAAGLGLLTQRNAAGDSCDTFYNIQFDPLFVNTAAGDYHLQQTSPCLGVGDSATAWYLYDFDELIRPLPAGSNPEIGAFESDLAAPRLLRLLTPNGGEEWRIVQYDTVRWLTGGLTAPLRIELNRHYPLNAWEVLRDSTANDGSEAIFVTDPISDSCRVRIRSVDGEYRDSSDANFSISASQGYLALARESQPGTPILSWSAGTVACPQTVILSVRLKNFGSENLVAFAPQLTGGTHFTLQSSCAPFFALSPGQMSTCSLRVTYNPQAAGTHRDTLRIQTDAINAVGGYVQIPLSGTQTRVPAAPQVVIDIVGSDARLTWTGISGSVGGCPVSVTGYLVFYSPTAGGPFYYHGFTTATSYLHPRAVQFAGGMYYQVVAYTGALGRVQMLPPATPEARVMDLLRQQVE